MRQSSVSTRVETARAGEVYHWPAGHAATADEGVDFIEIGSVAPMRKFGEQATSGDFGV